MRYSVLTGRVAWLQHGTLRRMSVYPERSAPLATADATGAVGGRVARCLASAGQSARLIVLDVGRAPDLPEMEVVEASYDNRASMHQALASVHTFFIIPVHESPDRVERHVATVDATVAAGVE